MKFCCSKGCRIKQQALWTAPRQPMVRSGAAASNTAGTSPSRHTTSSGISFFTFIPFEQLLLFAFSSDHIHSSFLKPPRFNKKCICGEINMLSRPSFRKTISGIPSVLQVPCFCQKPSNPRSYNQPHGSFMGFSPLIFFKVKCNQVIHLLAVIMRPEYC